MNPEFMGNLSCIAPVEPGAYGGGKILGWQSAIDARFLPAELMP